VIDSLSERDGWTASGGWIIVKEDDWNNSQDRLEALHAEREKLTSDAEVQAKTAIAIGDALEDQGVELSPPQMIYVAGIALEAAIAALNASPKDSPDAP
jgi:hypothetical protein